MTADATVPGGMGTFGWDDDGVPAMRTKLVDKGTFVGYLTSRETAAALGVPVAIGSARAEGWQHFPIVRMVNVSLDAGTTPYADLLRGADRRPHGGVHLRQEHVVTGGEDRRMEISVGFEARYSDDKRSVTSMLAKGCATTLSPQSKKTGSLAWWSANTFHGCRSSCCSDGWTGPAASTAHVSSYCSRVATTCS